ncbi:MAG: hypothetical protein ACTSQJ_17530, partial [Promethearchaeota archaeon]
CLLPSPDFLTTYFFIKMVSIYITSLFIIISFVIIKKLFNKNYLIFLGLLLIIIARYFLYRMVPYLSSSLAAIIVIISFIIIINKYPDYVLGFFLITLYFINILSLYFYIFSIFVILLYRFIFSLKEKQLFRNQLLSFLYLIIISLLLLTPYIIGIYVIYGDTIWDLISYRTGTFFDIYSVHFTYNLYYINIVLQNLIFPLDYFKPYIDDSLLRVISQLLRRTINIFFIFSFIGLFLYIRQREKRKDEEILLFFKSFIIVALFFYFVPLFFPSMTFIAYFNYRIMDCLCLGIIIMALFCIEWTVEKAKLLTVYLMEKIQKYKSLLERNKVCSRLLSIESIFIIILLSSAYAIHDKSGPPINYYYYNDDFTEVILYLRQNAEPNSNILSHEFEPKSIINLFYDINFFMWNLTENSTYNDLLYEIENYDTSYLIYKRGFFSNGSIDELISDNSNFKEKLKNEHFVLYKI